MKKRFTILRRGAPIAVIACLAFPGAASAGEPPPPPQSPAKLVELPPPPPAQVLDPTPPRPAVTRRTVAFAAAGVALLGAGLATTFGVLALTNKSAYESHPTFSNSDDGNNDAAYADGAIALAVVAGLTSVILFMTEEPATSASTPKARSLTLAASPFLTPHGGAGVGALVRF